MSISGVKRRASDDEDEEEASEPLNKVSKGDELPSTTYSCTLPPTCNRTPSTFASLSEQDSHYRATHMHSCIAPRCGKVFPDERFLSLHITECHDPIALVKADRGEAIFACMETTCRRKFSTPKKRRLHLIDYHKYPKEFYFNLPKRGLNDLLERFGAGVSLVGPGWKPRPAKEIVESDSEDEILSSPPEDLDDDDDVLPMASPKDDTVDGLTNQLQRARLIPPNLRCGRRAPGRLLGARAAAGSP